MSNVKTNIIAARYAKALVNLGVKEKNAHRIREDLGLLKDTFTKSNGLQVAIKSKVIDRQELQKAFEVILKKLEVSPLVIRFCKVMIKNGRISALPETITAFNHLLAGIEGEVTATVTAAVKLTREQLAKVETVAKKLTDKKINIVQKVKPEILGGIIVNIGSKQIDASVKGKLDRLRIESAKQQAL